MTNEFRTDLEPQVLLAEAEILKLVRGHVPAAELRRIGPLDFGRPGWDCWIVSPTDVERERISGDPVLLKDLAEVARTSGFPPDTFTVQSQETVEREYEGSWFYAMR